MTVSQTLIRCLRYGPATSRQGVDSTGFDGQKCAWMLGYLYRKGAIYRRKTPPTGEPGPRPYLYSLEPLP